MKQTQTDNNELDKKKALSPFFGVRTPSSKIVFDYEISDLEATTLSPQVT